LEAYFPDKYLSLIAFKGVETQDGFTAPLPPPPVVGFWAFDPKIDMFLAVNGKIPPLFLSKTVVSLENFLASY